VLEHLRWTCHAGSASHAMTAGLGRPRQVAGYARCATRVRDMFQLRLVEMEALARRRSPGVVKSVAVPFLGLQTCLNTSSMR
jgi:hypothetical protein